MGADMKTAEKLAAEKWEAVQIEEGLFHILPVERTANRVPIAVVDHHRDGHEQTRTVTAPSNAALLAAAPAMYQALKDALEEMQNFTDENEGKDWFGLNCPSCDGAVPLPHSLGCRIKSALKSAEGK